MELETLIGAAWELAWNIVLPTVLLFVGVYFTIGMRFFPLRRFGTILRSTLGQALTKHRDGAPGILAELQALNYHERMWSAIATLQRRVVTPQNAAPRRFAPKGPQHDSPGQVTASLASAHAALGYQQRHFQQP